MSKTRMIISDIKGDIKKARETAERLAKEYYGDTPYRLVEGVCYPTMTFKITGELSGVEHLTTWEAEEVTTDES